MKYLLGPLLVCLLGCTGYYKISRLENKLMSASIGLTSHQIDLGIWAHESLIETLDYNGYKVLVYSTLDQYSLVYFECYFINSSDKCVNALWWAYDNNSYNYPSQYYTYNDDELVSGYYNKYGTYVNSYYRTKANNTRNDNYSHVGNVNPYTGQPGYKK